MVDFKLIQTDDYEGLRDFFIQNELEFSEEDETPTDIVKCFRIVDESVPPCLIGGIVLAKRDGEFIIDGIAVAPGYRNHKLGAKMLNKAISEVKDMNGSSIYLVARAPGFFRTQGFEQVAKEDAPNFFECLTCPQYGKSCHPEIMKLNL